MNETKVLIKTITKGIQERKGKNIVIADLAGIDNTICNYFIICQGNSANQIESIVDSIKECTNKELHIKPVAIDGLKNAEWVAIDYIDIIVHVFLPEIRTYYNLEHLWADAQLNTIPDMD